MRSKVACKIKKFRFLIKLAIKLSDKRSFFTNHTGPIPGFRPARGLDPPDPSFYEY